MAKEREEQVDETCAHLFREHPFFEPSDFVARIRTMLREDKLRTVLDATPSY